MDKIGRGTFPKDRTSLVSEILEKRSESKISGMFATHLHDILKLSYFSLAEERLPLVRIVNGYILLRMKFSSTVTG